MTDEFLDVYERVVAGADIDDGGERTLELCRDLVEDPETVALPDGRTLGYADVGDPDGEPLVVFHQLPAVRRRGRPDRARRDGPLPRCAPPRR